MPFEAVKEQLKRLDEIEADIQNIERRIKDWQKQQAACRKIAEIPGVGMLTATAFVATMVSQIASGICCPCGACSKAESGTSGMGDFGA